MRVLCRPGGPGECKRGRRLSPPGDPTPRADHVVRHGHIGGEPGTHGVPVPRPHQKGNRPGRPGGACVI